MTLATALAALSLYPWSIGVNVVHTWGESSVSHRYSANGAYIVLDRREKDLIALGYEELGIKYPGVKYLQRASLARTSTWVTQYFRPGLVAGWVSSNDIDDGQIIGLRVDGEAGSFGYTLSQSYGEWTWFDWASYDTIRSPIRQSNLAISYNRQAFAITAEYVRGNPDKELLQLGAIGGSWRPITKLDLSLQYGLGHSRFQTDWTALAFDNNPDDLTEYWKAWLFYRPIPQIGLTGIWGKKFYLPVSANNPHGKYSADFYVAGLQVRI